MAKVVKEIASKVLSARVTSDVYNAWQNMAKTRNVTISECFRDMATNVDPKKIIMQQGGILVPKELGDTLGAIGGGSVVGILVYKGIKASLEQNGNTRLSENEIEAISMILAISGAMLVGTGIHKALSK
jgi:hypothetical protein